MNDGSITMTTSAGTTTVPGYVAGTWDIDPVHSEVGFAVRHMMVSKVRGKFKTFSGQIVTGENPLESSVTAEIDLASIETGAQQRDDHIRSADFFEVETYPTMTYRSTGIRTDGGDYIVDGDLTLKGVTKQVPLTLELNGFGVDFSAPMQNGGAVVADKITIHLEIEAVLKA